MDGEFELPRGEGIPNGGCLTASLCQKRGKKERGVGIRAWCANERRSGPGVWYRERSRARGPRRSAGPVSFGPAQ
jgi:hypothetical protein